jgi:hypothetical protein
MTSKPDPSSKSSIKDIFCVLLANPAVGRLIVDEEEEVEEVDRKRGRDEERTRGVRLVLNDWSEFLGLFTAHVGKELQWKSVTKRLRRAGLAQAQSGEVGRARVFSGRLSERELRVLWSEENTYPPAASMEKKRVEPSSKEATDLYKSVVAVEQMMLNRVKPAMPWQQRFHVAAPFPCVVLPEPLPVEELVPMLNIPSPTDFL